MDKQNPKYDLDLGGFIQSQGLQTIGMNESGSPIVHDPKTGQQFDLDLDGLLKAQGITKADAAIKFNSPESAIPFSPESRANRAAMSLGTSDGFKRGAVKDLMTRYQEVKTDPNLGVVVNNKGLWQQVDPSFFGNGDPWQIAKDFAKIGFRNLTYGDVTPEGAKATGQDLKDIGTQAFQSIKGAVTSLGRPGAGKEIGDKLMEGLASMVGQAPTVAGQTVGALGGVPGEIAGAGAGAFVGAPLIKSLGRALGTYDAGTPEEELKDNFNEAIMQMGGTAAALGVRPLAAEFLRGVKYISGQASDGVKGALASMMSHVGSTSPMATQTLFHKTEDYLATKASVDRMVATGGETVATAAAKLKLQAGQEIGEKALPALNKQFGENWKNLLEKAESDSGKQFHMGHLVSDMAAAVNDMPQKFGQFVENDEGKQTWRWFTDKDVAKAAALGRSDIEVVGDEIKGQLAPLFNTILNRQDVGELKPKPAAEMLRKMEREITSAASTMLDKGNVDQFGRITAQINSLFKNNLSKAFDELGVGPEHEAMLKNHSALRDAAVWAKQIAGNQMEGGTKLADALLNLQGKKGEANGYARDLIGLLGARGQELDTQIRTSHAVAEMAPLFKGNLLKVATAGGASVLAKSVGIHNPLVTAALVPAIVQTSSPKLLESQVLGTRHLLKALQSMDPHIASKIVGNDQAFSAFFRPILEMGMKSDAIKNQLLNQAGQVIQGMQQQPQQQGGPNGNQQQ